MIAKRPSNERGHADHGWLNTYHTFSFADYMDPDYMGFRSLRVINEDRVAPGQGFGTHSHHDMEIITYVLEGALEHKDSMGNTGVIHAGEVQRITAGTGIAHSEYNHSSAKPVHFLQIWIVPDKKGLSPGYEQKSLLKASNGELCLIASNQPRDGAVKVHQDMELYVARIEHGQSLTYELKPGRYAWLQVARGSVTLNGIPLHESDGAAVSKETTLTLAAKETSEVLLFSLA